MKLSYIIAEAMEKGKDGVITEEAKSAGTSLNG